MPASSAGDDVERDDHLPVQDARQARRLLVVADGVEQAPEAGAAQREDDQRRQRHEQQQRVGDAVGEAGAEPGQRRRGSWCRRRSPCAGRPAGSRVPTRLVPSVMISGCTRKTPTPMPLASPISTAGTSAIRIATAGSWLTTCVAMMKARHRRDRADGKVDAAGQHGHGLAAGEDGERDGELDRVGDPALVDDAGTQDLQDHDQDDEQDDQRHQRLVAHEPPDAAAERDAAA